MKVRIDELAGLMEEFKLSEAEMAADGFRIAFKKRAKAVVAADRAEAGDHAEEHHSVADPAPIADQKPAGIPITSPMTGIFYGSPNPTSPPFVVEGDEITAGQTIGLIEAMKVFNEIPAPTSGKVQKLVVESGQLVNLGDPLMYIG